MGADLAVIASIITHLSQANLAGSLWIRPVANEMFSIGVPSPVDTTPTKAEIQGKMDLLKIPRRGEHISQARFFSFLYNAVIAEVKEQPIA
jgi:hypothetical protein